MNLKICSDRHEEICYECKECPLCECIAEKQELEWEVGELKSEIDDIGRELNNLSG